MLSNVAVGSTEASFLILASVFALSCGGASETSLDCEVMSETVGAWKRVEIPRPLVDSGMPVSDGAQLIYIDGTCRECAIAELDAEQVQWTVSIFNLEFEKKHSYVGVSPRYILTTNALFDRELGLWFEVNRPDELHSSAVSHWTGSEFLKWGGSYTASGTYQLETDTEMVAYYDGSLFNPETREWRALPPAREDVHFPWNWGHGGPSLNSVFTSHGLFVWGTNPERSGNWGAIFDVDAMQWTELETSKDLPPLRTEHQLLTVGDDVYLFGGKTSDGERSRRIFRYDTKTKVWTEIDVPSWADPRTGAVVDDKLVFLGQCENGARYDPVTDTWDALAGNGPPSLGVPRAAGSFLTVTDTNYGEIESEEVWILDLRE